MLLPEKRNAPFQGRRSSDTIAGGAKTT